MLYRETRGLMHAITVESLFTSILCPGSLTRTLIDIHTYKVSKWSNRILWAASTPRKNYQVTWRGDIIPGEYTTAIEVCMLSQSLLTDPWSSDSQEMSTEARTNQDIPQWIETEAVSWGESSPVMSHLQHHSSELTEAEYSKIRH